MDDMERYGDYNEVDEPPKKSIVGIVLKSFMILIVLLVVGTLGFRMVLFNYYPDSMKQLYFTDSLTAYYNANSGNISAKTQELRAAYDNPDSGNFFCSNLIVIPELGQLQITIRYNVSLMDTLTEDKTVDLQNPSPDDPTLFTYRLYKSGESKDEADHIVGTLVACESDSFLMYRYYKLVFDGIDFGSVEYDADGKVISDDEIDWIRLEVFVKGDKESEPYSRIAIYENHAEYSKFTDYTPSAGEKPQ